MCESAGMSAKGVVHDPPPTNQGPGHQTALHRAAMVGNSDAMAALIQGGCAVDLQDRVSNRHTVHIRTQTPTLKYIHALQYDNTW